VKVLIIIKLPNYETLTVEDLFSKLKSLEIDHQTLDKIENHGAPIMVLSQVVLPLQLTLHLICLLCTLCCLLKGEIEFLGDKELALAVSQFAWFYNNRMK
jgi:hypothetical protein